MLSAEEMIVGIFDALLDKLARSGADKESTSFREYLHGSIEDENHFQKLF